MKTNRFFTLNLIYAVLVFLMGAGAVAAKQGGMIIHDAEHNILKTQHGERWAKEDAEIDAKLAEIRKKNGGKPPNFVFILLDDLGFGEIGMPDLDVIRGYSTPRISKLADEGLSLMRMYTEPSCTPTRACQNYAESRVDKQFGNKPPIMNRIC